MKINRTLRGDSAVIVVFTIKLFILQEMARARLAGYHLLPFGVGMSCRENKVANAQAQNTRHI